MYENTYCGESNLLDIVLDSIKKISGYLEKECIKELDVEDISRELKLLEPTLTIVLSKWASEILYLLYLKVKGEDELQRHQEGFKCKLQSAFR